LHGRNSGKIAVAKPNTLSLLTRIFRATVLDGMQWPALFSIVLVSALYYFNIAHHESLAILTITCILVIGLIRGCNAWQNDLNEYHHQLALARHQELDDEQRNVIPGYFPSRHY
jgi:hypothetical protein